MPPFVSSDSAANSAPLVDAFDAFNVSGINIAPGAFEDEIENVRYGFGQ